MNRPGEANILGSNLLERNYTRRYNELDKRETLRRVSKNKPVIIWPGARRMSDFSSVYSEYYPKIVRYLQRMVGELEAEDAAQEVFVKINRSLDSFRGESNLSTWIYRIATNTAMDHLRKPSSRIVQPVEECDEEDAGPVDTAPLHDTLLIRKDMNACIRGVVDSLPENYRTVLVLSEVEGLTNADVAEVLGISLDTAKIRLHRARAKLRKELLCHCNFYRDERNELSCDPKTFPLKFLKK
jgi:RNA polymerase sigma-70 factor (ECF subfamily)